MGVFKNRCSTSSHQHSLGCSLAALLPTLALGQSAPTTGTLQITARIEAGCRVVGHMNQTSGLDFGTLNFGSHPSIFPVALTAQSQGPSGTVQLTCSSVVNANVSVSTGQYAIGNQRRMANGANRVAYDLFADSGFVLPFTGTTPRAIAVSASGSTATVSLPIYGRVAPFAGGHPAGNYQDDVQITVTW